MAQGDAVIQINSRNLAQVQIDLPTLAEQRAIAAILSDFHGALCCLIADANFEVPPEPQGDLFEE